MNPIPLVWIALAFASSCHDEPPAAGGSKPFPDDVRSVLDAAVAAQNATPYAADLEDFEVELLIKTRDAKKGTLNFDVKRAWRAPDSLWTHVTDGATGREFEQGFDGKKTFWLRDKQGVKLFEGPDYKADRDLIREDLELMKLMMRFCFLENSLASFEDPKRLPDETLTRDDAESGKPVSFAAQAIATTMELPDVAGGRSAVTLWFDATTAYLARVQIEPQAKDRERTELRFLDHKKNQQDVVVPGVVEVLRGSEKEPSQEIVLLGAGEDGELNNIRFNAGVDPKRFDPPVDAGSKADAGDGGDKGKPAK